MTNLRQARRDSIKFAVGFAGFMLFMVGTLWWYHTVLEGSNDFLERSGVFGYTGCMYCAFALFLVVYDAIIFYIHVRIKNPTKYMNLLDGEWFTYFFFLPAVILTLLILPGGFWRWHKGL